jgi:hypothetical protein
VETLTHGFAAEAGEAIPSSTVTGRAGQWRCRRYRYRHKSVRVSPPAAEHGALGGTILYAAFDKTFRLDFGEAVCCSPMTGTSWNV